MSTLSQDKFGRAVRVGNHVRLLCLSGRWIDELPNDERQDVLSMIGGVYEIVEIDEYGHPWVQRWFKDKVSGIGNCHFIALDSNEMELVDQAEK